LLLLTLAGLSLNPLTARLLPVAVFFLTIYSYTNDALNPRTQNRHLPKGLVKPWETLFLALVGLLLLTLAGLSLNPLTARLLPVAVFFLTIYSYT
ncbi:UbiA family prenyltransferase, partial [Streptococcus pneumoniae]|uniref:UbiA family prenyltransferase n=1 Tax=Streptococcus pneumoniae TaxID=1313 RepID=UPI001CB7AAFB